MNLSPLGQRLFHSVAKRLGIKAIYEGAQSSDKRSNLPGAVRSARFDVTKATRKELVRKARWFEKNDAIFNRMADLFESYTVGAEGLKFFPATSNPDWNRRALAWWNQWSRYADLSSRMSFGTLQAVAARSLFVDGEVFIVLTSGESKRPRLQLIEAHRISTPQGIKDATTYQASDLSKDGPWCVDGIEVDKNGRPVRYWVAEDGSTYETGHKPVDAAFMVHIMEPCRPGQFRGLPYAYPVFNDLHDLNDLQALEMQASKEAAKVSYFVKTATGEVSDEALLRGETVGADGKERDEYYKDTVGAEVKILKAGDEVDRFASDRPSVTTQQYWDYVTARACAGVGIPVEIVLPRSMQGTTMRAVLDMANAYFRARSAVMADQFRRVYEYVMGWAKDNVPELAGAPADWYECTTRPPAAINADTGNKSAALINEYKVGLRNMQDIYAERGEDWRSALRQKAEEMAYAKELAAEFDLDRSELIQLTPNETAAAAQAAPAPSEPDADDEEDDDEQAK